VFCRLTKNWRSRSYGVEENREKDAEPLFHAWGTKNFARGENCWKMCGGTVFTPGARNFSPQAQTNPKKKKIKKKLKIKNCASGVGFPPEAEKAADSFFTHEA
jgi:hypothetical protein